MLAFLAVGAAVGTNDLQRAMAPEDYAWLSTHSPSMLKALPIKAQALALAAARGAREPAAPGGGALGGSRPSRGVASASSASAALAATSSSLLHLGAVAHRLGKHDNASSFALDFAPNGIDLSDPSEWRAKMGIDFSMAALTGPNQADAAFIGEHVRVPAALGASLAGAGAEGSLNWVHRGIVPSEIPDQGQCSSCWAFVGAASIAASVALAHLAAGVPSVASPRSAQQFVSCDEPMHYGCRGGTPAQALSYARLNAIELQAAYPYASWAGEQPPPACALRSTSAADAAGPLASTLRGYRTIAKGDEASLLDALRLGPVAVGVDASSFEFLHYASGVLDIACGRVLNHAMLIVGFGYDAPTEKPYWVLRNSWGSAWGEGGYMRLVRGKNMCGVADLAAYPVWNAAMLGTPWQRFVRLWRRHLWTCVGVALVLGLALVQVASHIMKLGSQSAATSK